ncbi:hypothetical protein LR69_00744 [Geobacillus sp. BCO2]|nr:hypothetical protein LR69_00744 [Geobacillus sp. BCO2]
MIDHELTDIEHLFTEQLQEGYYVIRETYQNVLVEPEDGDTIRQVDAGTEEVVTIVFDPGDEYSSFALTPTRSPKAFRPWRSLKKRLLRSTTSLSTTVGLRRHCKKRLKRRTSGLGT